MNVANIRFVLGGCEGAAMLFDAGSDEEATLKMDDSC